MPDYRRAYTPGGSVFLTLVTFDRRPIFETCKLFALQPGKSWIGKVRTPMGVSKFSAVWEGWVLWGGLGVPR
jgi:REP element-mobilizing transposase RayT